MRKKKKPKFVNVLSTRLLDYAQAIRATYYKQGERNLLRNVTNGDGYEGVIEIWCDEDKKRK